MSSNTKVYEDKMKSSVEHLGRELGAVRAGRANPAVLDKVSVDYYGAPTPIQQVASVAVAEARTLTITPWTVLCCAHQQGHHGQRCGITPIDDGSTIRLNFPAPPRSAASSWPVPCPAASRQMLAMAVSLMSNAPMLMLDELPWAFRRCWCRRSSTSSRTCTRKA